MKYELYETQKYFRYLIDKYNKASSGDQIILATMEFRPDQKMIGDVVQALCQASSNGARVTFLVDAYSFMVKEGSGLGPMFFSKREPKNGYGQYRLAISSIKQLRESGVQCHIINKPVRPLKNPFGGRSHIKFAVFNDEVFVGGCNLSHPDRLDVMVKTNNHSLANYMTDFANDVADHQSVRRALKRRDASLMIDDETELLIDAGVKRQSLIYERAFDLINNAAHKVYMTCQYFPNTYTPAVLASAHVRGVDVHLAYNHPHQHPSPLRSIQKRTVAFKRKRLPSTVFENQLELDKNYLHAKILLSEKEAIIGSHNFVKIGVNLGTAEIALHSRSKEFIESARSWIKSL